MCTERTYGKSRLKFKPASTICPSAWTKRRSSSISPAWLSDAWYRGQGKMIWVNASAPTAFKHCCTGLPQLLLMALYAVVDALIHEAKAASCCGLRFSMTPVPPRKSCCRLLYSAAVEDCLSHPPGPQEKFCPLTLVETCPKDCNPDSRVVDWAFSLQPSRKLGLFRPSLEIQMRLFCPQVVILIPLK